MKKCFRNLLIVGLVATSVFGLSACKDEKGEIPKYYIDGLEQAYDLKEEFVVIGKTLNIPLKDGTTKEVTVTAEMVKQVPDVLTIGEQELVIEYEGVEYKFIVEIRDVVQSYSFGGKLQWGVNEEFNPADIYMTVVWESSNPDEMFTLTQDMIVTQPDMSEAGVKLVEIEFNGQQFSFNITIV